VEGHLYGERVWFYDARGRVRRMGISTHAVDSTVVISLWQGDTCTGTFRMPAKDGARLISTLTYGMTEAIPDHPLETDASQTRLGKIACSSNTALCQRSEFEMTPYAGCVRYDNQSFGACGSRATITRKSTIADVSGGSIAMESRCAIESRSHVQTYKEVDARVGRRVHGLWDRVHWHRDRGRVRRGHRVGRGDACNRSGATVANPQRSNSLTQCDRASPTDRPLPGRWRHCPRPPKAGLAGVALWILRVDDRGPSIVSRPFRAQVMIENG
jgi:hypothetical protein